MKEMKEVMIRQMDRSRNAHELYKDIVMVAKLLSAECLTKEEADELCQYSSNIFAFFEGEDRNLNL